MATFVQVTTAVSKKLLDPNNTAVALSDVQDAVNESVAYWKFKRFWFNTVRDSATLTPQVGSIPLPTNFLVPFLDDGGFEIEYSNARYLLRKLDQTTYDGLWLGNGYGRPSYYSNLSGTYNVYPLPDQAYTIRRNYLEDYPALTVDGDTNDFLTNANLLIQYWTLAKMFRDNRQDSTMSEAFFNSAQDEYANLSIMTTKSNATGGLLLHTFL